MSISIIAFFEEVVILLITRIKRRACFYCLYIVSDISNLKEFYSNYT